HDACRRSLLASLTDLIAQVLPRCTLRASRSPLLGRRTQVDFANGGGRVTPPPSPTTERPDLAKRKRVLRWQRDPEGMRLRILEAAKQEFSAHGIGGARVDRIAEKAGANKRMLYYHVGNKEELYLAVLEGAYEKIRAEERELDLEHLDPPQAIERLIDFTWNYFIRNPEFLALLNTENLAKAKHLKRSTRV